MNWLYYLHFTIPLSLICMPLLPNKYLRKIFFAPALLYFVWIIFDGCPWTEYSQKNMKDTKNFIAPLLKKYINKDITPLYTQYIIGAILSTIIIISAYKLIWSCKKY